MSWPSGLSRVCTPRISPVLASETLEVGPVLRLVVGARHALRELHPRRRAGEDPEGASPRDADTVEHYLQ
jgi:hypothetical protein